MVSIRKWRHLGIQERYKILNRLKERKRAMEPKAAEECPYQRGYQDCGETRIEKKLVSEDEPSASFYASGSSVKDSNNEYPSPPFYTGSSSLKDPNIEYQGATTGVMMTSQASIGQPLVEGPGLKSRKSTRRKQPENHDTCLLRGVYFKNMKWQAAIKVEKKQIHLGTVASMEEAAHLYDRAAYLCGRVPNFELTEEEKQELQGLQWEEFLQMTKASIANKKKQKRVETSIRRRRSLEPLEDGGFASQYTEPTSAYQQVAAAFNRVGSFGEPTSTIQPQQHALAGFDESMLDESAFVAATLKSLQQQGHHESPAYGLPTSAYDQAVATVASGSFYQQTAFAGTSPYP